MSLCSSGAPTVRPGGEGVHGARTRPLADLSLVLRRRRALPQRGCDPRMDPKWPRRGTPGSPWLHPAHAPRPPPPRRSCILRRAAAGCTSRHRPASREAPVAASHGRPAQRALGESPRADEDHESRCVAAWLCARRPGPASGGFPPTARAVVPAKSSTRCPPGRSESRCRATTSDGIVSCQGGHQVVGRVEVESRSRLRERTQFPLVEGKRWQP